MILKPHHPYRISRTIEEPKLAGKTVVFLRYLSSTYDVRRAVVALMNPDGSCGEEWRVVPSLVLPIR